MDRLAWYRTSFARQARKDIVNAFAEAIENDRFFRSRRGHSRAHGKGGGPARALEVVGSVIGSP